MASSENVERKQVKREFPVLKNLERLHLDGGNHLHKYIVLSLLLKIY
jgi:hypothetical protein